MTYDVGRETFGYYGFLYFCTRKGINLITVTFLYPIKYKIMFFNGFIPESV